MVCGRVAYAVLAAVLWNQHGLRYTLARNLQSSLAGLDVEHRQPTICEADGRALSYQKLPGRGDAMSQRHRESEVGMRGVISGRIGRAIGAEPQGHHY